MPLPHDPDGEAPAAVHLRLDRDLLGAVRAFAEATGRTRNEAVDHLLRLGLDAERAPDTAPGAPGTSEHVGPRTSTGDTVRAADRSPGAGVIG